jgi:hypothetical protein
MRGKISGRLATSGNRSPLSWQCSQTTDPYDYAACWGDELAEPARHLVPTGENLGHIQHRRRMSPVAAWPPAKLFPDRFQRPHIE